MKKALIVAMFLVMFVVAGTAFAGSGTHPTTPAEGVTITAPYNWAGDEGFGFYAQFPEHGTYVFDPDPTPWKWDWYFTQ